MNQRSARSATLGDVTITESDLEYLKPFGWLNDNLISVWCEHIIRREYGDDLSKCPVSILLPNVTFLLLGLQDENEWHQISKAHDLKSKQIVLAIVNDSPLVDVSAGRTQPSGDHWSVVVFDRRQNCFYHLDSLPDAPNGFKADQLITRLKAMLSQPIASVVTLDVPLQRNSYDCGKFVLIFVLPTFSFFFFFLGELV